MQKKQRRKYTKKFFVAVSLAEPQDTGIISLLENAEWGEKARILRNALRLYWKEQCHNSIK
ncbi:MAG: hypothetical protein RML46_09235 [Anaerolineae bacterium]|nr:hypothetical protein [Anaerolineae bacterium]